MVVWFLFPRRGDAGQRCGYLEEKQGSDVDILVQYTDSDRISLFTISRIICTLQKILGKRVDLVEDGCLLPFATASANHDRILIYEREG